MKSEIVQKEVLTKEETASYLQLPLETINYLCESNQIPYSRIGKRLIRFYKPRLDAWLIEREGVEMRYNVKGRKK